MQKQAVSQDQYRNNWHFLHTLNLHFGEEKTGNWEKCIIALGLKLTFIPILNGKHSSINQMSKQVLISVGKSLRKAYLWGRTHVIHFFLMCTLERTFHIMAIINTFMLLQMSGTLLSHLHSSLNSHTILYGLDYYCNCSFTGEETEVQRGKVTYLRSQS